ncbi:A/G-specific adenine glycosylase [bacterium]|nr:A/G-specific adenine glycosylase [bacterium]
MNAHNLNELLTGVLGWYRGSARRLPWRIGPADRDTGVRPDPYRVWLSEVMLQQTTIPHVIRYFLAFTARWETVDALAAANWDDVSAAWAGLGYYSRARNLHACAKLVAAAGVYPQEPSALQRLPGVGPYTSAAIAAIAFDHPVLPVDGNIERVISRIFVIGSDRTAAGWRDAKRRIADQAGALASALARLPPEANARSGDLAQALMDLGATLCAPRSPRCAECPVAAHCAAAGEGVPDQYPMKPIKTERPSRRGDALVLVRGGEVFLVRRPPRGLLGGMLMPPSTNWTEKSDERPLEGRLVGEVTHVFTHFRLTLGVWRLDIEPGVDAAAVARDWGAADDPAGALWLAAASAPGQTPSVGAKALRLALGA